MKNMEISMSDYEKIERKIDSMMTEEEIIEAHEKLAFKTCKSDYFEIEDCGVEFVRKLLYLDWGRSIVYCYSNGAEKFMQSKYLSDYLKNKIKELLVLENFDIEDIDVINSDKTFNDMSEEEIGTIYSLCKKIYDNYYETEPILYNCFMLLLYKLNGDGAISFLKNNINKVDLAKHILLTSGLNSRASFYSGRGVNYGDLNEKNLVSIFLKLFKFDTEYAIEFVKMVKQMKTLGATEFINSFISFANNGFVKGDIKVDNVYFDDVFFKARDIISFVSTFSTISRGDDIDYQISESEYIKDLFLSMVNPFLLEINSEVDVELYDMKKLKLK